MLGGKPDDLLQLVLVHHPRLNHQPTLPPFSNNQYILNPPSEFQSNLRHLDQISLLPDHVLGGVPVDLLLQLVHHPRMCLYGAYRPPASVWELKMTYKLKIITLMLFNAAWTVPVSILSFSPPIHGPNGGFSTDPAHPLYGHISKLV